MRDRKRGWRGCLFWGPIPLYRSLHAHDEPERILLQNKWRWVLLLPFVRIIWRKDY